MAAFISPDGLAKRNSEKTHRAEMPVLCAVTDHRVLFAPVHDGELTNRRVTIPYQELLSVEQTDTEQTLQLTTTAGTKWQYWFPTGEQDAVDAALRHLQWVGNVRARLVSTRNDTELVAGEIRNHAADMEWEEGRDCYESVRQSLDRLIADVQRTTPVDEEALAPELTDVERTLEKAATTLFIEQAESQIELGKQLVGTENYEQARKVLSQANSLHGEAVEHYDALERSDAFQFGEQRELRDDLNRVRWEIDTVMAEPVRLAYEAKIRAEGADDENGAVDRWEAAFRQFGTVLRMARNLDSNIFVCDRAAVCDELEHAAEQLVSLRKKQADESWSNGLAHERAGKAKEALRACQAGRDQLERAHELAAEFDIGDVEALERRLNQMDVRLTEIRESVNVSDDGPQKSTNTESRVRAPAGEKTPDGKQSNQNVTSGDSLTDDGTATPASEIPSVESLSEIDTHHEIRLHGQDIGEESTSKNASKEQRPSADEAEGGEETDQKQEGKSATTE